MSDHPFATPSDGDYDISPPERCVHCDSPSSAHAVPHGYLCHDCYSDEHDQILLLDLPTTPLDAETHSLGCPQCHTESTLEDRFIHGFTEISGSGVSEIGSYETVLVGYCECGSPVHHLATEAVVERVRSFAKHDPHVYRLSRSGRLTLVGDPDE